MKRIFAVVFLIVAIASIYLTAHSSVNSYCKTEIKNLNKTIGFLENNDYDNTIKSLKKVKDTKSILKYLYFEDVNELDKSLKEAVFYAKHQDSVEAMRSVFKSLYIIKSFQQDFSLNLDKVF